MSSTLADDNDYGFDNSATDKFLGQTMHKGLLDVDSSTGKKGYYALVEKRGASDANTPLVLGMPGGPGMTSMWYLFKGLGPYKVDRATGNVSLENTYSVTNFAHYLLPEFPLGTGYSTIGEWCNSMEDFGTDAGVFMDRLSTAHPTLVSKTRPLILQGSSYAGTLLPFMALVLKAVGWNVKGVLITGGWVESESYVSRIPQKLYNDDSKKFTYPYWSWWGKISKMLLAGNIVGSRWSAAYMSLGTTSGFPWTRDLTKAAFDSRDSTWDNWRDETAFMQNFLQSDKLRTQMNGGESKMHMWNKDVARSMFYNTAARKFGINIQNCAVQDIKVMMMEGEYGHPTDINSQLDWYNKLGYAKQGFIDKTWQWTTFGAMKGWGNVCFEKVSDSGSFVEFDQQVAVYTRLQNLALYDGICN